MQGILREPGPRAPVASPPPIQRFQRHSLLATREKKGNGRHKGPDAASFRGTESGKSKACQALTWRWHLRQAQEAGLRAKARASRLPQKPQAGCIVPRPGRPALAAAGRQGPPRRSRQGACRSRTESPAGRCWRRTRQLGPEALCSRTHGRPP